MKLVTNTELLGNWFGDKKAVEMIKNAGFDAVDYSMFSMGTGSSPMDKDDYKEYAHDLRSYAESIGISFVQGHAPFPGYDVNRPDYTEKTLPMVFRAVEVAGILGIEKLVVHPLAPTQIPADADLKEFNFKHYRALLPLAKEGNVQICLENMWGYDSKRGYIMPNVCSFGKVLAEYLDELDDDRFTVCLDLGHSGLVGDDAADAIRTLGGKRLTALHVHDNDYKNDTHTLPYYGKMDWESITTALGEINYSGNFTFEAAPFYARLPHDEEIVTACLRYMADTGRYLMKKIDAARK